MTKEFYEQQRAAVASGDPELQDNSFQLYVELKKQRPENAHHIETYGTIPLKILDKLGRIMLSRMKLFEAQSITVHTIADNNIDEEAGV